MYQANLSLMGKVKKPECEKLGSPKRLVIHLNCHAPQILNFRVCDFPHDVAQVPGQTLGFLVKTVGSYNKEKYKTKFSRFGWHGLLWRVARNNLIFTIHVLTGQSQGNVFILK